VNKVIVYYESFLLLYTYLFYKKPVKDKKLKGWNEADPRNSKNYASWNSENSLYYIIYCWHINISLLSQQSSGQMFVPSHFIIPVHIYAWYYFVLR